MKVKLERMDWENVKTTAKDMIRNATLQIINAKYMLGRAEAELLKYDKSELPEGNKV